MRLLTRGRTAAADSNGKGSEERIGSSARLDSPTGLDSIATLTIRGPSPRDALLRRLLALSDICALLGALVVADVVTPLSQGALVAVAVSLPLWVLLNKLVGLYDRDHNVVVRSTLAETPRIVQSVVGGASLLFLAGPVVANFALTRGQTLTFILGALALTPLLRFLVRASFDRRAGAERALVVGSSENAERLVAQLAHYSRSVQIVGFLDEAATKLNLPETTPGAEGNDLERFGRICQDLDIERVVVAFSAPSHEDLLGVISISKQLGLKVTIAPHVFAALGHGMEVEQVGDVTLLGLRGLARTGSSLALKRALDVGVAGLGLLMLFPLLAAIALAVKLTSPGPAFFGQLRIGRRHVGFCMWKFRTMREGADELKAELAHLNEAAAPMFKIAHDPRITSVGGFLRRYSLDELPQLWNVLRGEMSLVGPRPLVPNEDGPIVGRHRFRLDLTPGLTGPWQVAGRTAIPFEQMIELDYAYVAQWSLWNDLQLLARTAPVVLRGQGR